MKKPAHRRHDLSEMFRKGVALMVTIRGRTYRFASPLSRGLPPAWTGDRFYKTRKCVGEYAGSVLPYVSGGVASFARQAKRVSPIVATGGKCWHFGPERAKWFCLH